MGREFLHALHISVFTLFGTLGAQILFHKGFRGRVDDWPGCCTLEASCKK